ncbi:LysR family transcriptional regulator [Paenibacillus sp. NPDC056722]|uniref:LysR family transcriptional regulator n=1 Tax=Paenibacillus sp. NPDC056722 TaxID=3345924 RepID=UPI0036AFE14E
MELTYLRTFCEVAACGSYTKAAERLGYAQSSVTSQIAKLEEMYGAVLLERAGRGMTPTFAGKGLLPYARQMLALSEEAKGVVSGGYKGQLVIGAIETLAAYYLPHRLHLYRSAYPDIRLRVQPGSETEIIAAVRDKTADFGLIFDEPFASEDLVSLPLREESLFVVMHPGHAFALQSEINPEQLAEEPLVLTEDTCTYRNLLLHTLRQCGVTPGIDMEFGNLEGIKQAVKHRWGTAFLPGYAIEEERQAGSLAAVPLAGGHKSFSIQLIYPKERWLSPAFRDFIKGLQE